ncbi:ribosomal protein L7/L12 [Streptomyces sp. NPDC052309]|uniref:ribosomal protein bL12 n=1 Tax=Streptomyces sp. NPDC052309 TaxID=3155421 RepID=UPI00341C1B0C
MSDEQDEFTVVLVDAGRNKVSVIKALRELTGLGLAEAKEMADQVPTTVLEAVDEERAQRAKLKLHAAGATVELN